MYLLLTKAPDSRYRAGGWQIYFLQCVEFFYGKPSLFYEFSQQAGTEFVMLRNGNVY